jgi:hypothetical protein
MEVQRLQRSYGNANIREAERLIVRVMVDQQHDLANTPDTEGPFSVTVMDCSKRASKLFDCRTKSMSSAVRLFLPPVGGRRGSLE